ncbi:phospholipase D family protein [Bacillus suaedae]|uniref:phospholipase D n=1 Tax=Halalkalibacter suaedae TaxID=2822140 RepID=A0A941AR38_9BACI|nr:phospholipase D family protein [Bacillus suaedae]MBP3953592.1 phospholipase D family protein [Bacillus suaedae]
MKKHHYFIFILIFIAIASITSVYHVLKPLPPNISFEGVYHDTNVEFLYDLTYQDSNGNQKSEQVIFDRIMESIDQAEEFIVIDMFLFNHEYDRDLEYPELSMRLSEKLIERKIETPTIEIVFITDEVNQFYGAYSIKQLKQLQENDIDVIETNMGKLRDSNPIYSGFWRSYFQWFGTSGGTWLPNPFGDESPEVNIRSYLKLLNFKANHRKVIITENEAIVTSANPHDASSNHSNIAFVLEGNLIEDLLKTEKAVADFSDGEIEASYQSNQESLNTNSKVKVITEGKIEKELLASINQTEQGDQIKMGMFYLADRDIISSLKRADNRGVDIQLILDPNKDAFGMEKSGIPNRQVASELKNDTNIDIRWYWTQGEQYHAKLTYIQNDSETIIIGGSANLTKRNLSDLNLETNIMILADENEEVSQEVALYFDRLWSNEDGVYTADYSVYQDDSLLRKVIYRIQEFAGLSTF